MSTGAHTETDPKLPLQLTRLRRPAAVEWTDSTGPHRLPLTGTMVVGTAEGVPLRVVDARVSRLHAELTLDDGGIWVRDLGSTNGTWVDSVRVDRVRLEQDGRFRLGSLDVSVRFDSPTKIALWPQDRLGSLLGRSDAMRELFMQLTKVAASDASVLIHGETGTGKELVAQELHAASRRASKPLVVVDCASLPENLLEAELFGHARGAFTGAVAARTGSIEAAEGGTVFLDEVGELPLSMQPKLLRVLESKSVRRVGENEARPVNVRFVCATHRDLEAMVAQGQFREDLFFRLAVLPLHVPPLRSRPDDLDLLLTHFLAGREGVPIDTATKDLLRGQRWPGNVRQLKGFAERVAALGLERAVSMLKGVEVTREPPRAAAPAGNPLEVDLGMPFKDLRERWVDHLEREYLKGLISKVGRNAGSLSDSAGLDRSYINRLLKKHEL
ncbi:MAG: sigma 54-interacting transcriptional regulator [Myxococcales bacterium]|nr:sigma 54-interacting transcriptional regulator [Myxococcales bacterium]